MSSFRFSPLILIAFLFFIHPLGALAHGTLFFEFAPDEANALNIFELQTPTQPFYPPSDFLRGFDVWIANTGSAGAVTFELRNASNVLLASKAVTIPYTPHIYGGTRFHIDFDTNISVDVSTLYKIRVVSTLSNFFLYNASQFQILQHNTSELPYYGVEQALLGTTIQNYAFKLALYETEEDAPPILSGVTPIVSGPSEARVEFHANEAVDAQIKLISQGGTSTETGWSNTYTFCMAIQPPCVLTLSPTPNTTYTFTLFARDEWGNTATHEGTFTTPAGPTAPPPPSGEPPGGSNPPPPVGPPPPPPGPPTGPPPPSGEPPGGSNPPPPAGPPPSSSSGSTPPPSSGGETPPTGPPPPSDTSGQGPVSVVVIEPTTTTTADGTTQTTYSVVIVWNPTAEMLATDGYAVEIINDKNEVERRIFVSNDTRELRVDNLGEGVYRINVYANQNGTLIKLGDYTVTVRPAEVHNPFTPTRITLIIVITLGVVGGLIASIESRRKKKKAPTPEKRGAFDIYQH